MNLVLTLGLALAVVMGGSIGIDNHGLPPATARDRAGCGVSRNVG